MNASTRRRAAAVLVCTLVLGLASGCGSTRAAFGTARATLAWWGADQEFIRCTPDPRILCEPGSEAYANAVAALLPAAVARVERVMGAPFAGPVKLTVYSRLDSYELYSGGAGGGARVALGAVHMSPVLRSRPEWYAGYVEHELSHLHLAQRAHHYAMLRLPHWFREGYATWVADGGGAQRVTREQAVFMLVHGRHLEAVASEFALLPRDPGYYRMDGHMYYRQAALVVDYMAQRDRAAFMRMLDGIVAGKRFGTAVQEAYGQTMDSLWQEFQAAMRADPAAHIVSFTCGSARPHSSPALRPAPAWLSSAFSAS